MIVIRIIDDYNGSNNNDNHDDDDGDDDDDDVRDKEIMIPVTIWLTCGRVMTEGLPQSSVWTNPGPRIIPRGKAPLCCTCYWLARLSPTATWSVDICGFFTVRCWFSMTTILVFLQQPIRTASTHPNHVSAPKAWFWDSTRISSRRRCCLAGDCDIVVVGFQIFEICLELGVASWWLNHQAREKNGITVGISGKYDQSLGFYRNIWWSGVISSMARKSLWPFMGYGKIVEAYNS